MSKTEDVRAILKFVKSNVSIRAGEDDVMLGFLSLAEQQSDSPTPIFLWIPKGNIPTQDIQIYREVASRTRKARLEGTLLQKSPSFSSVSSPGSDLGVGSKSGPGGIATSFPFKFLSPGQSTTQPASEVTSVVVTEAIFTPVADIHSIILENGLTLADDGDSICLPKLSIHLSIANPKPTSDLKSPPGSVDAKSQNTIEALLPELWIDPDEAGKIMPLEEVEKELRAWFLPAGIQLARVESENPNMSQKIVLIPYPITKDGRVPLNLSQDSTLYKLGALSLGVVSGIVGEPIANKIEDVGWDILERFSKVTQLYRDTRAQVLEHPLARPFLTSIPPQLRSYFLSSAEAEMLLEEYDSAAHYFARWAHEVQDKITRRHSAKPPLSGQALPVDAPLDTTRSFEALSHDYVHERSGVEMTAEYWIALYNEKGQLMGSAKEIQKSIFQGGIENDIRCDVWRFLLGMYPWDSTEKERILISEQKKNDYAAMKQQWKTILAEAESNNPTGAQTGKQTSNSEDPNSVAGDEQEDGDVVSKIRERKYRIEKDVVRTDRAEPFFAEELPGIAPGRQSFIRLKSDRPNPISEFMNQPSADGAKIMPKNLEMLRDVLVTYTMYNYELGYVQGMNDLLAPILAVMRNEVDAFWCFVGLMEQKKSNFNRDQSGMREQLLLLEVLIKFMDAPLYAHLETTDSTNMFCCFRWLLVVFKREFKFRDIMRLWETLWSSTQSKHYHLFIALAILNMYRHDLMRCKAFDEILKFINDLSNKIDLESILIRAEVLSKVFAGEIRTAVREKLGVNLDTGREEPVLQATGAVPESKPTPKPASRQNDAASAADDVAKGYIEEDGEIGARGLWALIRLLE